MSHLPIEALRYETLVAEYFLGLRGAGLMLSPLDLDLVKEWSRRGLPAEVVCRGLRRGLEEALRSRAPGSPPPRSLRAYRLSVEDEWSAYRYGRVGSAERAPDDEAQVVVRRLEAARALLDAPGGRVPATDEVRHLLAAALARPPPDLQELDGLFERVDDLVLRSWLRSLERPRRATVGRRCGRAVGRRLAGCTPRAHRDSLRMVIADLARRAGLTLLRGSV